MAMMPRLCLKTRYLASSGSFALWLRPAPSPYLRIWLLRRPCQRPKQLALGPTVAFSDRASPASGVSGPHEPGWLPAAAGQDGVLLKLTGDREGVSFVDAEHEQARLGRPRAVIGLALSAVAVKPV